MSTRLNALAYNNGDYELLNIEFNLLNGFPEFNIAGMRPAISNAIKYKFKSQVVSSGYKYLPKRKVASFHPSRYSHRHVFVDVPLVLAYLVQTKQISYIPSGKDLFIGEIGLDGKPSHAPITQKILDQAVGLNFKNIFVPKSNLPELISYTGLNVIGYSSVKDLVLKLERFDYSTVNTLSKEEQNVSFDDVVNNYFAKKMLTVAIGTFSNILIVGEPGIGKTLLLKSIKSILPKPSRFYKRHIRTESDSHPCSILDSTLTKTDLLGCSSGYSLYQKCNMGVLGVNEVNQLSKSIQEIFKSTLEGNGVMYKGNHQSSHCAFVGTMNPCKCGYSNSKNFECVCNEYNKEKYIQKLGLPFLDRFDLYVDFNSKDLPKVLKVKAGEEVVSAKAQIKQLFDYQEKNGFFSSFTHGDLKKHLNEKAALLLDFSSSKLSMSMRRQVKTMKLALAISILKEGEVVYPESIYESITIQKFYYDLLKKKGVR